MPAVCRFNGVVYNVWSGPTVAAVSILPRSAFLLETGDILCAVCLENLLRGLLTVVVICVNGLLYELARNGIWTLHTYIPP